jgi:hypothetical protein
VITFQKLRGWKKRLDLACSAALAFVRSGLVVPTTPGDLFHEHVVHIAYLEPRRFRKPRYVRDEFIFKAGRVAFAHGWFIHSNGIAPFHLVLGRYLIDKKLLWYFLLPISPYMIEDAPFAEMFLQEQGDACHVP